MSRQERHLYMYQQIFKLMLEAHELNLPYVVINRNLSRKGYHAVEFTFDTSGEHCSAGKRRMDYRIGRIEISVDDEQSVVEKVQEAFRKVRQMNDEHEANAVPYEQPKNHARAALSAPYTQDLEARLKPTYRSFKMHTISPESRFHCQWPEGYGDLTPVDVDRSAFTPYNAYDETEYAAIASLAVGETCVFSNPTQKHTVTRVPDAGSDMFVLLESVGNPDHGQDPNAPMCEVSTRSVRVKSLEEASKVCRDYIDSSGLGGGNWSGGLVTSEEGIAIAEISYNGRIWPGGYSNGNAHLFQPPTFA